MTGASAHRPADPPADGSQRDGLAVVIGAQGGLGAALCACLRSEDRFTQVLGAGRSVGQTGGDTCSDIDLDITDESSIELAAVWLAALAQVASPVRLVIDATGFLHGNGMQPEKSWRDINATHMAHAFAVNAIGPALLMKHFLPLLPRSGKAVFATLSAKVGSIGDNRLGGWYSYRASKAALNQLVRTASIELARKHPEAICVALHPGTVATRLSSPFAKSGLDVQTPQVAAARLLSVIGTLTAADSGGFFNHRGEPLPW